MKSKITAKYRKVTRLGYSYVSIESLGKFIVFPTMLNKKKAINATIDHLIDDLNKLRIK